MGTSVLMESSAAPARDTIRDLGSAGRLAEVGLGYQQILEHNPTQPVALVGMCLVALASRQPEAAVKMAQAAVEVAPKMGPAWVALGQAHKAVGDLEAAEKAYWEAISLDGMDPLARMGMGELRIALDRPQEAVREYELALQKNPVMPGAHLGLGHSYACMERYTEAMQCYEQTLRLRPQSAEAEFAAGFCLVRMGKQNEAEARYRKALTIRPDFAAAWLNMGSLFREQGREMFAEAALIKALELRPDLVGAWLNLAMIERDRKNRDKAEKYLRKAFALEPERVDTHVTWAQFCCNEKDLPGAWGWLRWALARDPKNAEAVNMHGILLHTEGRFEEAVEVFGEAEELGNRAAPSNRGNSLLDLGRVDEALRAHEKAVERDPESAGANYNLAMTRLRTGDFERGWQGYEARWNFRSVHRQPRVFTQPRWKGEPLAGRRVLLHAEQGLGDSIQFSRYVSLVISRGGTALLQVQTGAQRLLSTLGAVQVGLVEMAELGVKPPHFDLECPLMSLPAIFGTTLDTVPWHGPYIGAKAELVREKRDLFPDAQTFEGLRAPRIGVAWAGNPGYKADRNRSTKLETFLPLLRLPEITWISLQKGEPAAQLAELTGGLCVWDGSSQEKDLAETAALISTLDMVITTDTCIAHLAGAMGKPVWILLAHFADWRWMRHIETSPWYPTARLFRQTSLGDWEGLIKRVIAELSEFRPQLVQPAKHVVERDLQPRLAIQS